MQSAQGLTRTELCLQLWAIGRFATPEPPHFLPRNFPAQRKRGDTLVIQNIPFFFCNLQKYTLSQRLHNVTNISVLNQEVCPLWITASCPLHLCLGCIFFNYKRITYSKQEIAIIPHLHLLKAQLFFLKILTSHF